MISVLDFWSKVQASTSAIYTNNVDHEQNVKSEHMLKEQFFFFSKVNK